LPAISTLAVVIVVHLNAVLHFDESRGVPALSDIRGDFVEKNIDEQVLDALKKVLQVHHYLHSSSCCCLLSSSFFFFYGT